MVINYPIGLQLLIEGAPSRNQSAQSVGIIKTGMEQNIGKGIVAACGLFRIDSQRRLEIWIPHANQGMGMAQVPESEYDFMAVGRQCIRDGQQGPKVTELAAELPDHKHFHGNHTGKSAVNRIKLGSSYAIYFEFIYGIQRNAQLWRESISPFGVDSTSNDGGVGDAHALA